MLADGKEAWKSKQLSSRSESVDADVSVQGAKFLTLEVSCPGDAKWAHAVWIEPRLEPVALAEPPPSAILEGHQGQVWGVAFLPDGQRLISGGADKIVRVWNLGTRRQTLQLEGHTDLIRGVAVSRDGSRAATASNDRTVRVWDLGRGRVLHILQHPQPMEKAAFSRDGRYLVAGGLHDTVALWDLDTTPPRNLWAGRASGGGYGVVFAPGDLAAATSGVTIDLVDLAGRILESWGGGHGDIYSLAYSPDEERMISGHTDGVVRLWRGTAALRELWGHKAEVTGVAFAPDAKHAFSCGEDRTVRLWDLDAGREIRRYRGFRDTVRSVAVSGDGAWMASASYDGLIRAWALDSPLETGRLAQAPGRRGAGETPPARSASVSPAESVSPVSPGAVPVAGATPAGRTASDAAPTASDAAPTASARADPAAIERAEFRHQPKPIERLQASVKAMTVRVAGDGQLVGAATDIIAISPLGSRQSDGGANFVREVGNEMRTSCQEAIRAVKLRYPVWRGSIELSFAEKYNQHDGGSAGTAFGVLMLALLEDFEIDPRLAMTGDITVDWRVRSVGGVPAKLRGAILDKCELAAIPASNADVLSDAVLVYGESILWEIQVFGIETLQDAASLARRDRPAEVAEAIKLFAEIQPKLRKGGKSSLKAPENVAGLEKVFKAAPNHLSAQYLLRLAKGELPSKLSISGSLNELFLATLPFGEALWAGRPLERGGLPAGAAVAARKRLLALRALGHKDVQIAVSQLLAFVDAAERVSGGSASQEFLAERRETVLGALNDLQASREVLEKLMREGY